MLSNVSYYRISAYFIPFMAHKDCFNNGVRIDQIESLYRFDSTLRLILFKWIEKVEIALKTRIIYFLAQKYSPLAYLNKGIFSDAFDHGEWVKRIKESWERSTDTFKYHFENTYKRTEDPPLWMIAEVVSIGSISSMVKGLKYKDQKAIARTCDVEAKVLTSWLHSITYARNLCAHHSRLWNRNLAIKPMLPKRDSWNGISNRKPFVIYLIINFLDNKMKLNLNIKKDICETYTTFDLPIDLWRGSGFPENWEDLFT